MSDPIKKFEERYGRKQQPITPQGPTKVVAKKLPAWKQVEKAPKTPEERAERLEREVLKILKDREPADNLMMMTSLEMKLGMVFTDYLKSELWDLLKQLAAKKLIRIEGSSGGSSFKYTGPLSPNPKQEANKLPMAYSPPSHYQIWLSQGNEGTKEDFLAMLRADEEKPVASLGDALKKAMVSTGLVQGADMPQRLATEEEQNAQGFEIFKFQDGQPPDAPLDPVLIKLEYIDQVLTLEGRLRKNPEIAKILDENKFDRISELLMVDPQGLHEVGVTYPRGVCLSHDIDPETNGVYDITYLGSCCYGMVKVPIVNPVVQTLMDQQNERTRRKAREVTDEDLIGFLKSNNRSTKDVTAFLGCAPMTAASRLQRMEAQKIITRSHRLSPWFVRVDGEGNPIALKLASAPAVPAAGNAASNADINLLQPEFGEFDTNFDYEYLATGGMMLTGLRHHKRVMLTPEEIIAIVSMLKETPEAKAHRAIQKQHRAEIEKQV